MIASARSRNATPSCINAWVPTTTCASPDATCASTCLRARPVTLPASQATRTPSGSSQPRRLLRCCSASSSVGAINAACLPVSTASIAASAATTVLPLPTSPCTSRSIGDGRPRSARISSKTRCWADVSTNGKALRSNSASLVDCNTGAACACWTMRWRRRLRWWASNSSSASRRCAGCMPASSAAISASCAGRCTVNSASRSEGRFKLSRSSRGSSSSDSSVGRRSSASPIRRRSDAGPMPSIAG